MPNVPIPIMPPSRLLFMHDDGVVASLCHPQRAGEHSRAVTGTGPSHLLKDGDCTGPAEELFPSSQR